MKIPTREFEHLLHHIGRCDQCDKAFREMRDTDYCSEGLYLYAAWDKIHEAFEIAKEQAKRGQV